MRLWLMDEVGEIEDALKGVIQVITERADKEKQILMPGYTHLQVRTTHILLIYIVQMRLLYYSELNPSAGPTLSSSMHSRSSPTYNAYVNLSPASPYYHWVRALSQVTLSSSIASSSPRTWDSSLSRKTACGESPIETL
jgi:hypothetical protein